MAIQIQIQGLTAEQLQDVAEAFDSTMGRGPNGRPDGMSKARWAELCIVRYIKSRLSSWKRNTHASTIEAELAQVNVDFPEA